MTESIIQPEPFDKNFCMFGIDWSLLNRVPCVLKTFTRSRALRAYVITCQRALSAYVLHESTCLVYLCPHVSTCLAISHAQVPTCLESLASHGLSDHVITCQRALLPQ